VAAWSYHLDRRPDQQRLLIDQRVTVMSKFSGGIIYGQKIFTMGNYNPTLLKDGIIESSIIKPNFHTSSPNTVTLCYLLICLKIGGNS
jgi:hypothetical protein